jgi:3',5'-cyclic AMP phosphodiesterase CpdA
MDPVQMKWIDGQLAESDATWKICFFHHPLYSDGKTHGPSLDLRRQLEPIFLSHGVSLVLSGHEHFYERIKPQGGITYIILGNSGRLRPHDIRPSQETEKAFDTDRSFMLVEIAGDRLYFQTISRKGETIDSGVLTARPANPSNSGQASIFREKVRESPLVVGLQRQAGRR